MPDVFRLCLDLPLGVPLVRDLKKKAAGGLGELGVWVAVDRPASSEDVSSRIFVH